MSDAVSGVFNKLEILEATKLYMIGTKLCAVNHQFTLKKITLKS